MSSHSNKMWHCKIPSICPFYNKRPPLNFVTFVKYTKDTPLHTVDLRSSHCDFTWLSPNSEWALSRDFMVRCSRVSTALFGASGLEWDVLLWHKQVKEIKECLTFMKNAKMMNVLISCSWCGLGSRRWTTSCICQKRQDDKRMHCYFKVICSPKCYCLHVWLGKIIWRWFP